MPPAPGMTARLELREPELGVVTGNEQVARHRELAAATQGEPADGGDDRHPQAADLVENGERVGLAQRRGRLGRQLADVDPRGERPVPGARDDDRAARRIGVEGLEVLPELAEQRERQGVQLVRPIEGEQRDARVGGLRASREVEHHERSGNGIGHRAAASVAVVGEHRA